MAATFLCQDTETPPYLAADRSNSFADAWSSLFSSFSDQHVPWQTPDQTQSMSPHTDFKIPITSAAAVHQSAVFAALFEEMVTSQSHDALMHIQQPQAASNHSSAVSLCDSAASFSFSTARQTHTAAEPAPSCHTLQPHPAVQRHVAVGSHNVDKAALSVTLRDWQMDADLQSEPATKDTCVEPFVEGLRCPTSRTQRSSQHSYSKWQAAKNMHSTEQADVRAMSFSDAAASMVSDNSGHAQSLTVSHAITHSPASKRMRRKAEAAHCKGVKAVRPWRTLPSPTMVAASPLKQGSSAVTASQTMQMHLNKVAWWLDLQASQSMGHLCSKAPCDPLTPVAATAVVEHESPAALHSGSADAAEHAKLPADGKMSASIGLSLDQLSSAERQPKGSRQPAEGIKPSMGNSQGVTGSSQAVDGSGRLQQRAVETPSSPVSTSQEIFASAAVSGSPGNCTAPPQDASARITLLGPELQRSSEREAAAVCKAERAAAAASKETAEESRQQVDHVGRLQAGDCTGHSFIPSASTELFLRLEAAAGHEPEASAAGRQNNSHLPVESLHAHAVNGHHAAPYVPHMSSPLQAKLPEVSLQQLQQQQQPQKLQQQLSGQEEDVYAGVERGSNTLPMLVPSWYTAVGTTELPQAQHAPVHTVKQDSVGRSIAPQQGPSRTPPEPGLPRNSPEHGSLRHRDRAGVQCKAEPNGNMTPKAAEAPLVKQGSYAVAAKVARLRNKRRQQEIEELNGSQRQVQIAPGDKQHAEQAAKPVPTQRGLLIGSYRHPGPSPPAAIAAASSASANSHSDSPEGNLAFPTLSPLSSRPSTVSANHRYASSLATETSLTGSEAESAAESAAGGRWDESWGQQTAACASGNTSSRQGLRAAQSLAGVSPAPCHPPGLVTGNTRRRHPQANAQADVQAGAAEKQAERPHHQAESASPTAHSRCSAKLQAHRHAQHPCKPPVTPPALKSARASRLAKKLCAVSPVGEEDSRLLAALQRLGGKLGSNPKHGSHFEPEQPQQAQQAQHAASSSSRVPSPAQHSRLPALLKPLLPQCGEATCQAGLPPSTPDVQAGPTAKPAGKKHSRRVTDVNPVQAGLQPRHSDFATARSIVSGGDQARRMAGRTAAAQLRKGSRTGAPIKGVDPGSTKTDVSNSAEQQALQQSLAKLDARLINLSARCTGAESPQLPTSLPSCISAPITRQSSFLRCPQPHAAMNHFPSRPPTATTNRHLAPLSTAASSVRGAANARQQGSHCPLPAVATPCSRVGGSAQTGQVPQGRGTMPDASLMLPESSQCPSVASAPCTAGSCKPRRYPGLHDKPPGAARAVLLARSRIPRPRMAVDVPPQQHHFQQQQHSQQQQLLLGMPAGSIDHRTSSHSQPPTSQDPYHYLSQPRLPIPTGSDGLPQPAAAGAQAAPVTADGASMQRAGDQHFQGEMLQDVSCQQQQQGVGLLMYCQPSAAEAAHGGLQYGGRQQQQQGQSRHQHVLQQQVQQMSLARQLQHQQPTLQPFGQQMQHGQSMPATRAGTPWVQHAWYPALPGGYQPPLTAPFIAPEHMQHERQQPNLGPAVSRAQFAIGHIPLSQYGTSQADMSCWTGHGRHSTATHASEAANTGNPNFRYNCSPKWESSQLQQQQQLASNKQVLQSEFSALSPPTKVAKGVIKTYNLKALLS